MITTPLVRLVVRFPGALLVKASLPAGPAAPSIGPALVDIAAPAGPRRSRILAPTLLCLLVLASIAVGPVMGATEQSGLRVKLSINVVPAGGTTLALRATDLTGAKAECTVRAAAGGESLALPAATTSSKGQATWQWLVLPGAPSGSWKFTTTCRRGPSTGHDALRAIVVLPSGLTKTSLAAADSIVVVHGRAAQAPRRQVHRVGGRGAAARNPGDPGYCTWGAWNLAPWLGTAVNRRNGRNGDARNWYDNAREAGLPTGTTPIVGAVFVHRAGTFGHVGIVTGGIISNSFATREMNGGKLVNANLGITTEFNQYADHRQYYGPGTDMFFIYPPGTQTTPPATTPPTPSGPDLRPYIGHIVQWDADRSAQRTAWLVGADLKRRWIPDASTYNCLKSQGVPGPDVLPATVLDLLTDQDGTGGKPLEHATCVSSPAAVTPAPPAPTQPTPSQPAPSQPAPTPTFAETAGGVANTWTNYGNAGGDHGPSIPSNATVAIACKVTGFRVADGNTWWYRIASAPWNNAYYVSADAFYNNGQTSGSLHGTPPVDGNIPDC